MSQMRPPVMLPPVVRVRDVRRALLDHPEFDCFPIGDPGRGGTLVGTILGKTLCLLLKHKATTFGDGAAASPTGSLPRENDAAAITSDLPFSANVAFASAHAGAGDNPFHSPEVASRAPVAGGSAVRPSPGAPGPAVGGSSTAAGMSGDAAGGSATGSSRRGVLAWADLQKDYPRFPGVGDEVCACNDAEGQCWLDLRPYINAGPYVVQHTTSVGRVYRMFRSLGLRHLCVVDFTHTCVGIITRKDLCEDSLRERAREVQLQRIKGIATDGFGSAPPPHADSSAGLGSGGGGGSSGGGSGSSLGSISLHSPSSQPADGASPLLATNDISLLSAPTIVVPSYGGV